MSVLSSPRHLRAMVFVLTPLTLVLLVLQFVSGAADPAASRRASTATPALQQVSVPANQVSVPTATVAETPSMLVGANVSVPEYAAPYRYGINFGWREGWNNVGLASIAGQAGATSARIKLPEWLFAQYGYDFEYTNNDMQTYRLAGLEDLTAFLIGPIAEHSNAPEGKDRDLYSPKNLYEPIWLSEGQVNPDNYWAAYVFQTVSTYKNDVTIWEVWNEPDFVHDWALTQDAWWHQPPDPADLPFWNDSIFSYIRLLRVSYEVVKYVDPTAFVAPGGLGYESFLDGILRYTDNPDGGMPSEEYPAYGGAYFDVMSFHHYPQYAIQDLATEEWYRDTDSDAAASAIVLKKQNMETQLFEAGYDGTTYPEKHWIATETGLASKEANGEAGGPELMQNYLAKMSVVAQANGIKQVHWFVLTDHEERDGSGHSNKHMGLYYDVKDQEYGKHELKDEAAGYATTSRLLRDKTVDLEASEALDLPDGVRGYVFTGPDGRTTYVLWARTANSTEAASAQLTLPSDVALVRHEMSFALDGLTTWLEPVDGQISVALSGTPVFLVEASIE